MRNRKTIYWACQILGWSIFYGQGMIVNLAANTSSPHWGTAVTKISAILFSVFLSHIMKGFIVRNEILKKPFLQRALILIFYSIIFGLILTFCIVIYKLYLITDPGRPKSLSQLINSNLSLFVYETQYRIFSFIEWNLCYQLVYYIIKTKNDEIVKLKFEKQVSEYEAKALRAQMNPHFIFNCLNSIKFLIQQNNPEKAISYLAIFSKVIRTLLNNADKKEISLFDEIETCKLYLQLEAMRLDDMFSYKIIIDEGVDMKSTKMPALIVQPFIENAIWHGIIPKGSKGTIELSVTEKGNEIEISIEDDGIGIEASILNKSSLDISHESKGLSLTEARLKVDNFLRHREGRLYISERKDDAGRVLGTRVILKINKEL